MKKGETKQELEAYNFHMEARTEDTHSLTPEEFAAEFEKKIQTAADGERKIREQMIIQSLRAKGIKPDESTIQDILENKKSLKDMIVNFRYFQMEDGTIIKISLDNQIVFKLNSEELAWREDEELLSKCQNGTIEGKEIELEDNYPTFISAEQFKL